jgi:hypothetical protein
MGSEYPEHWDRTRRRVYRRDDYTCQNCGTVGGAKGDTELHAHHITPRSQGGSDQPENLVTLCQACHSQVHGRQVGSKRSQTADSDRNHDDGLMDRTVASIIVTILTIIIMAPVALISHLLGWGLDLMQIGVYCGVALCALFVLFVGVE